MGTVLKFPTPLHFLTLPPGISLAAIGLNLDFGRSLCPQQHSMRIHQLRVLWEKLHLPEMLNSPLTRKTALWVCGKPLGGGILLPHFQEDYHGPGPSSDSFGETAFSIRRVEPELLQLPQPIFSGKAIKFVALLCAKLISIWL